MARIRTLSFLLFVCITAISLFSCSGVKNQCTSNCGVTGTSNVVVTVTSTPSQTFYFPYLAWEISSVTLINSANSPTILQGALPPTDFARLQTDSQLLGVANSVPAGTYTSAKIALKPSTASSYFYNGSGTTLFGCAAGAVCQIPSTVPGFVAATVTVPVSFTVSSTNNTGFSLNFDLSKAVTSAGGMTFDFTQTGAITLVTLPRAGQTSGLDSFQNFTGTVTAITTTPNETISMSSASSNTRTFTVSSTAEYDDPFTVCTGTANFQCIATKQNINVDAIVNSDGTLTAYEVDFLDPSTGPQESEGVIVTSPTSTQFQMVITNATSVTGFLPGQLATVTLNGTSSYFADPKNLGISSTPLGFRSSTDLVVGQTVMLQGGSINFSTNTLTGYGRTLLRYSSIGGAPLSPSGTIFSLSSVSPFFTDLSTNSVQVLTFPNTTFDNITNGFSGLTNVTNASVRGLYLNPTSGAAQPLLAAQVRGH